MYSKKIREICLVKTYFPLKYSLFDNMYFDLARWIKLPGKLHVAHPPSPPRPSILIVLVFVFVFFYRRIVAISVYYIRFAYIKNALS